MEKNLFEKITELVGEASMCWEPRPTGVFSSDKAMDIANRIMQAVNEEIRLTAEFK